MLKYVFTILLFISSPPVVANKSFADHFEYSASFLPAHANDITHYFIENSRKSSKNRLILFQQYNDSLKRQINNEPDNPLLWFSLGLNFKNRLDALEEQKTLGARNIGALITQTQEDLQSAFLKAMELDNSKKPKLTARMYATMKNNLSHNQRILALQKELSLGGSGDNETHYWFTHWDNIGSLQDEGRFDEAEVALYQMKYELKKAGLEHSDFAQVYQHAETTLSQKHGLSKTIEKQVAEKIIPPKKSNPRPLFTSITSTFEEYWFMVLLNIIVFISLIFAFLKREKD